MDLLSLANKAHSTQRRSKRKQGAQKVGCVNHAMVEQLTNSTMESSSLLYPGLELRLLDGTDLRVLQLYGSLGREKATVAVL